MSKSMSRKTRANLMLLALAMIWGGSFVSAKLAMESFDPYFIMVLRFFAGAAALAMGIGIQNFPEGAAVALPLRQGGWSRPRAFVGGMLSGAVEPVFGVLAALAAAGVDPLMPWLLSFAAGAMLYVVVEELIPQAHSRAGTCGFVMGFLVMMVLDVALGG